MSFLKYWIWLTTRNGLGSSRAKQIVDDFGSAEKVYFAGYNDYVSAGGLKSSDINELMKKDMDGVNKILSKCADIGCRVITIQDSDFPDRLRNIHNPPLVLYVKGKMQDIDDEPVVGIVGTRACTPYGIKTAEAVSYKLSRNGITVVTGLAKGIDAAAARGALRGGTLTIGVIGSGLDVIYPYENKSLYEAVASAGALVSEYSPGTPAIKTHFPLRNRIISGLSLGIAVIEAPQKSGALITAARALEQGRDVFSLPGNVDSFTCEGSNALLREGAIPFLSADDIIEEYIELYPDKIKALRKTNAKKAIDNTPKVDYIDLGKLQEQLDGDEREVVKAIGNKSLYIDDIVSITGLEAQNVQTALTMLELSGYVSRNTNGNWEIV
jgi:DNA processing protein